MTPTTAVRVCTGALAVLIGAFGWFYTFYSQAVVRLASLERDALNRRRARLRRLGGCAMMALGICFYAGFNSVDVEVNPGIFEAIWIGVCLLLLLLLVLAVIDLRLTIRLRAQHQARLPTRRD